MTGVFVMVVAIGLLIGWIVQSDGGDVAEIDQPAPDFSIEVIDGGTFTLSEAKGQPVVLNFWASWCGPCRTEIPDISAFADANPNVHVVGVAVQDTERAAREFAAEIGASYPLGLGTTDVENAYPILGLPATYLIDENGIVTEVINGVVNEDILTDSVG